MKNVKNKSTIYVKMLNKFFKIVLCAFSINTMVRANFDSGKLSSVELMLLTPSYRSEYYHKIHLFEEIFSDFKDFLKKIYEKKIKISDKNRILLMEYCADIFFFNIRRLYIENIEQVIKILKSPQKKESLNHLDELPYSIDRIYNEKFSKKTNFSLKLDEVYDKKSLENSLVLLNQELKAQALLLSFPSKIEKIENSKLLSDKTIAIFWKDIKEHLNKYSKVLDEVLSEVTEDFDAKTLNEKIDFIKNIQIEKKEKEIKNIIDEIKKNKKGFVNKFLGFVKK